MKQFSYIIMMAALLTACGHRFSATDDTDNSVLKTDSMGAQHNDSIAEVVMTADWPVEGNPTLVNILREYITEELQLNTTQYDDGRQVMEQAVAQDYAKRKAMYEETLGDGFKLPTLTGVRHITKRYETPLLVTYLSTFEDYQGGAHGGYIVTGTTFRKSDGRRMGSDMLRINDNPDKMEGWYRMLKEGVRSYFSANMDHQLTDSELQAMLIGVDDINFLPMPQNQPYFSENGLEFIYQQYEIAPYAAGLISFTLPYEQVRPYLKAAAAALIGQ